MMLKSQSHKVTKSQDKSKIKNLVFIFLTCVLCLVSCNLLAQPISSTELINNARSYDGKTVVYEGEVIGDVMVRGAFAWINVHDGNNAIGVWIDKDFSKDIIYTGSYKSKGDVVEVVGGFRRACPEHGGDLDIHAQSLRKVGTGREKPEPLNPEKRNQALVLAGILCLILILRQFKPR